MIIRAAAPQDMEQIIELCALHAEYEAYNFHETHNADALFNCLFVQQEVVHCLVVEENNQLLGYATYMKQFSTWEAGHYLYLDCLFLRAHARGRGIGRKLLHELQGIAQKKKCGWMEWQTPKSNENAIRFYKRIGAFSKTKERFSWKAVI